VWRTDYGINGGLTDEISADKISPNLGIKLSLKNGIFAGLIAGLIGGLRGGGTFRPIFGLIVGLIVGFNRGGAAALKHYALRFVLWRSGHTPFNFIEFLDYCAQIILLKKVGGGYIFIHRMLLEYFAGLKHPKRM
jgi:eukaryotic-like serine/threonine-protein kinase